MALEDDIKQRKFSSEYQKALVNIIFTSYQIQNKNLKVFKRFNITAAQYNVLRILRGQHPKPSTINLIIERMLDRMSNASRIVDKLEAKGLVIRTPSSNDRRAVDVLINEKGLQLLVDIDKAFQQAEKKIRDFTSDEAKVLNQLLDKFRETLE